jgi:hypothetical protein
MTIPTTDRAYARGEDAPAGLLAVRVWMTREYLQHEPAPLGHRVDVTYWVGLCESGAPNVDAAVQRAEDDHPGYVAQDWAAA